MSKRCLTRAVPLGLNSHAYPQAASAFERNWVWSGTGAKFTPVGMVKLWWACTCGTRPSRQVKPGCRCGPQRDDASGPAAGGCRAATEATTAATCVRGTRSLATGIAALATCPVQGKCVHVGRGTAPGALHTSQEA